MKAIVKLFILLFVLVNITKAQVILPMGLGQKNSLNVTCSEGDKMWVVTNENEKFVVNKWDGSFWIAYNDIPVSLLNTISTLPQSIEAKAICFYNNEVYLALTNKYNEKLLLIKNSGKKWEAINTETIKVSNSLTFLNTPDGLLLCGKITADNQSITILKINKTDCSVYAGMTANIGANDYFKDFEYSSNKIWAFGYFTINQESRYFAKFENGNWNVVQSSEAPYINGNVAFGEYDKKLVMAGVDFDGKTSFSYQLTENSWAEISNGLTDWSINSVSDLRQVGKNFWAAGQFTNKITGKVASLAFWNGTVWTIPNFDYLGNDITLNGQNQVLVSGAFVTYQNFLLNHTGILDFGNAIIAGKVFNDINENCTQEFGEKSMEGVVIKLTLPSNESIYLITDYNGRYYFPIDSTRKKNHWVELILPKYNIATCGSLKPATITSQLTIQGLDFGLKTNGMHLDAGVKINDFTGWRARQGYDENYKICVENKGTQKIESAKLTLKVDSRLSNTWTFSEQPVSWQNSIAEWNIKPLMAGEMFCFNAKTTIPLSIPLESEILFDTKIAIGDLEDEDLTNNTRILKQKIVAAIDPNDKRTQQAYYIAPTQKVIDYKIRFQNTGNDVADNVVVTDSIDPQLAYSAKGAIQESSHSMKSSMIYWKQANGNYQYKLAWKFENIALPDKNTNEEKSNGFINYTMNLSAKSDLPIGTTIKNQAYIYFDYQEPILTNIAKNVVSEDGGIKTTHPLNQLSIYPNPANDYIFISNPFRTPVNFNVINCLGQTVMSKTVSAESKLSIPTSAMAKGIYLIQAEGFAPVKILIN